MFSKLKRKNPCIFVPIFKKNFKLSHIPQRTEKDCLNCGTIVAGKYCQTCGQENVLPKETFWHMVTHFFYDITHFDSNFFSSVRHLIFRPGFLSKEYMAGKRARYLHPIRMYVFSSAMFFLLFFSVFKINTPGSNGNMPLSPDERRLYIKELQEELQKDTGNTRIKTSLMLAKDTSQSLTNRDKLRIGKSQFNISLANADYESIEEYEAAQKALPESERDGWFARRLAKKEIEINIKYRDDPAAASEKFAKSILHQLPYMLFVSLPLFALILKLVYIRRKQFYYADHGVFTIHLYIFTFILLMAVFGLAKLDDLTEWRIWGLLMGLLFIGLFIYLLLAMKRFYGQRWWKTIIKFLIVSVLSIVMMAALLLGSVFFTAFTF